MKYYKSNLQKLMEINTNSEEPDEIAIGAYEFICAKYLKPSIL